MESNSKTNTTTTKESTTKQTIDKMDIFCMEMTSTEEEMNTDVEEGLLMRSTGVKTI